MKVPFLSALIARVIGSSAADGAEDARMLAEEEARERARMHFWDVGFRGGRGEVYPPDGSDWLTRVRKSGLPVALWVSLVSTLTLANCANPPPATEVAGAEGAITTLAGIAALNNTAVAHLVSQGALFCAKVGSDMTAPFVLANAAGAPLSVTGQASAAVAAACAVLQAVPVSPPADAGSAPVVPVSGPVSLPVVTAPK